MVHLQITHLERKIIFQTSMIMFHINLQGCNILATRSGTEKPDEGSTWQDFQVSKNFRSSTNKRVKHQMSERLTGRDGLATG